MAAKKIIMAWSKCKFEIGKTKDDDTMTETFTDIGTIKDKSSTLESSDGDSLEMKATGNEPVASEVQEGGFKATTRIIEPTNDLLTLLGLGEVVSSEGADKGDFKVKTHIVDGDWSLKIKTSVSYKPGWSEEDGNYADVSFEILKGDAGYWYSKFKKAQA